ncbi:MAG TPA: hypothetical protein VGG46_04780 [Terriglobales bacterium]|jgi:hypothetical protein
MALTFKLSSAVLALSAMASAQSLPSVAPIQQPPANPATLEPVHSKNYDPLLDLPPLSQNKVSLMGGTVTKLDRVRDLMALRVFGGDETKIAFDVRTKFYRDGTQVKDRELQQGQRIYVDTMLNGTTVFAKNIWIQNGAVSGNGTGQIVSFDQKRSILRLRDELTAQTLDFQITPKTTIHEGNAVRATNVLVPGSLVSLTFGPAQQNHGVVQEVTILARPGYSVSFFGSVTFLDLSNQTLAVRNNNDGKTYEIRIDGISKDTIRQLHPGSVIGVSAVFDGKDYMARSLGVAPVSNSQ